MIYWQLLYSFFKIGLFGFGGGLAILSLIENEVEQMGWMTESEFIDIVAISQVTPGPIGINCATYVGYSATGSIWGSVVATFAIILPSLLIMLLICRLYHILSTRYQKSPYFRHTLYVLRLLVLGLIASAAMSMVQPETFIDGYSWIIFGAVATCMLIPKLSRPIPLIILSGMAGYLIYAPVLHR